MENFNLAVIIVLTILGASYCFIQAGIVYQNKKRKKASEIPAPIEYKNVGAMEGTWVIDGVRRIRR